MVALPSCSSIFTAIVTWGRSRISATSPGTCALSPPTPCWPMRMRSGARGLRALARAHAVPSVSVFSKSGSFRWRAESAPIARPLRSADWARSGPRETSTTSPPLASLIFNASSIANSS